MKRIYLAGGWFTPEMEEEHTRIYNILIDNNFDVYNPKLESLITSESTDRDKELTLMSNITAIEDADVVVVIYDRKDVGTIWEAGFAYAINKPIIYYAETLGDKPFNLMLAKTGRFASNTEDLVNKLYDSSTYQFKQIFSEFRGNVE